MEFEVKCRITTTDIAAFLTWLKDGALKVTIQPPPPSAPMIVDTQAIGTPHLQFDGQSFRGAIMFSHDFAMDINTLLMYTAMASTPIVTSIKNSDDVEMPASFEGVGNLSEFAYWLPTP